MPQLNVQQISASGTVVTFTAASAGGDTFPNDGHTVVRLQNTSGAPITVTVTAMQPCNQGELHNDTITVPANSTADAGPFSASRFNDASGNVELTYSTAVGLSVAAVRT